jgi:citrate lyase subunit beta / citryl-CoA lyase
MRYQRRDIGRAIKLRKALTAVGVNGVLVDAAHVKMAEATLTRAALIKGGR